MIEIYSLILKLSHDYGLSVTILFLEFQSFLRGWLRPEVLRVLIMFLFMSLIWFCGLIIWSNFTNPCQVTSSIYVLMLSEFWMCSQVLRVLNSVFWLWLRLTSSNCVVKINEFYLFFKDSRALSLLSSSTSFEYVVKFYEFWVCFRVLIVAKCYQFGCVLDVLRVLIASKLYGLSALTVIRIISKVYEF